MSSRLFSSNFHSFYLGTSSNVLLSINCHFQLHQRAIFKSTFYFPSLLLKIVKWKIFYLHISRTKISLCKFSGSQKMFPQFFKENFSWIFLVFFFAQTLDKNLLVPFFGLFTRWLLKDHWLSSFFFIENFSSRDLFSRKKKEL